jgi:hypothetical protein
MADTKTADTLASVMGSLSLDDIAVDTEGRVRIAHPELAKRIADLKGASTLARAADSVNTGTCNNTACFAPGLDQLAKRGNPAVR